MIRPMRQWNHGNSGGPLVNSSGALVGINSQIESEGGGNEGIAYAIPRTTLSVFLTKLLAKAKQPIGVPRREY